MAKLDNLSSNPRICDKCGSNKSRQTGRTFNKRYKSIYRTCKDCGHKWAAIEVKAIKEGRGLIPVIDVGTDKRMGIDLDMAMRLLIMMRKRYYFGIIPSEEFMVTVNDFIKGVKG